MHSENVKQAKNKLESCPITNKPHVLSFWDRVKWLVHNIQEFPDTDAEVARDGSMTINTFPSLTHKKEDKIAFELVWEFGILVYNNASDETKNRWDLKLVLPSNDQIDAFQGKLHEGFKSYQGLVESFSTACDRLVALNLANAMISNGQAFEGAFNVDVRKFGPTQEYANLKRYHSLKPLIGAYAPRLLDDCFGYALADCVCREFKSVRRTDVAESLRTLIGNILDTTRSA